MNTKGYVWDSKWIWPYESFYGMVSKFAYINVLNGNSMFDLLKANGCKKSRTYYFYNICMIISKYKIDLSKIGELFEFDVARELMEWIKELLYPLNIESFPYSFDYAKEQWFRKNLTYCPECMKYSYHSIYHQLAFTQHCFIHKDIQLQDMCPKCGEKMSYVIQYQKGAIPFGCHCGHRLFAEEVSETMDLWGKPIVNRKNNMLLSLEATHHFSLILPHDKNSIYWNQINREMNNLLEDLCVIGKKDLIPHYKFTFTDNGRAATTLKYEMYELYFEGMKLMKRHIRKLYRIHPNKMARHAVGQGYKVSDIGSESAAYLVWVKMNLGISVMDFIDSPKEVYYNTHNYSYIIEEKVCLSDLTSMELLHRNYPAKWKNVVCDRVVFRVILIKLWKSYQLYLKDIQEKYTEIKDMLLKDFFESYWKGLRDRTQVLLNLDDGSGEIWVVDQ